MNPVTARHLEQLQAARLVIRPQRRQYATAVVRLWPERPQRYSRALLETLALIGYRQPITRAEIEAVRGVAVNPNIIKTLLERSWIRVVGHRDVPGKPELLGTTRDFLDYFSLKKLDDLPTLAQLKELEDLRVQLTLPGAGPEAPAADLDDAGVPGNAELEAAADDDEEESGRDGAQDSGDTQDADAASPRPHGLVARGAQDDPT